MHSIASHRRRRSGHSPCDEAIEQHRLKGQAIAVSDEQGNPIEIQAQDITPLAQKQEQRQQKALSTSSSHSTTN